MSFVVIEDFLKSNVELFPHQCRAMEWMKERETTPHCGIRGGIMSMEMGMGKSLTSIAHTLSLDFQDASKSPTLIIASKTVMLEWKTQCIEKFLTEDVKVLYLHRDFCDDFDSIRFSDVLKYDVVVTTYDVCVSGASNVYDECMVYGDEHSLMKGKIESVELRKSSITTRNRTGAGVVYAIDWERVIADESQRFANPQTITYYCMMAICAKYRWCLSGTPIRNYDIDIWAQLRFCGYKTINRAFFWKRIGKVQFIKENLSDVVFVAKYADAGITLPEKNEQDIVVTMSPQQSSVYLAIKERANDVYKQVVYGNTDFTNVLAMLTKLRQCAITDYLLEPESKRSDSKHIRQNDYSVNSPKISKIIEIINSIPTDEKVCIFTSFTSFSDLIASTIAALLPHVGYVQVDGDKDGTERKDALAKFKTDPNCRVIIMTYRVGGEGLNLVEANHCIFGEPWWSTAVLKQAKARVWRTGQTRPVTVYNIITENTIEESIVSICKEKEKMIDGYLKNDKYLDKVMVGRLLSVH